MDTILDYIPEFETEDAVVEFLEDKQNLRPDEINYLVNKYIHKFGKYPLSNYLVEDE